MGEGNGERMSNMLPIPDLISPAGARQLWMTWAEGFLKESKQGETQLGRLNLVLFVLCAK